MHRIYALFRLAALALGLVLLAGCATRAGPVPPEMVVFFPSYAVPTETGEWRLTIHGRVYVPAGASRQWLVDALAGAVHVSANDPVFTERARHLVSDSSGNTQVSVRVGDRTARLPATDAAGYFTGELTLPDSEVRQLASTGGTVPVRTVPNATGAVVFDGAVMLVPEEGLTVISDMDDTIKDTNMLDASERNANTFGRPFRAVEGMAALYRGWAAAGTAGLHFHLVSAGPWQLHEPLRRFVEQAGYPDFTWDMRSLDLPNLGTLLDELQPQPQRTIDFKVARITEFMRRFPRRRVVLVGDSGEMDPEAYAKIVADFPGRVERVFIRNVRSDEQAERYARLYPAQAFALLRVFREPSSLPPLR